MRIFKMGGVATAALFGVLATLPANVSAQDQAPQVCTAQVEPGQVAAGAKAVQLTVTVSEPIGPVTGVEGAEDSGIALAAPADLPRTDMAATGQAPAPIAMGDAPNTWVIWINTTEAEEGLHEVAFTSSEGQCSAELEVQPNG